MYDPKLEDAVVQFAKEAQWVAGTLKPNLLAIAEEQKQNKPIQRGKAMEPSEPVVKPGWQSTEFWLMLVAQLAPLAVLFKIIPQEEIKTVQDTLSHAIQNVAALVGSALMIWKYIQSRGVVKAAAQTAKAAQSSLMAADMNMRAATMEGSNRASRGMV